ncbi:MAG: hypothetical protein HQL63_10350 [Magnetococcales bacterium]|nr:hypothetical protein [Magnetococcales bacterium]MBF0321886.1 hypothetical protein [Magnetococcales bacterium]
MKGYSKRSSRNVHEIRFYSDRLAELAEEQVRKKQQVEERWLEDLRQYHGKYDPTTLSQLGENQSRIFVNLTRSKANTAEARLTDMLFPTDDRNWGIKPTPVPDLWTGQGEGSPMVHPETGAAIRHPETGQPVTQSEFMQQLQSEAQQRAEAMQREMEDQLVECQFLPHSRSVIHDAVILGTGIMKGPMVNLRIRPPMQLTALGVSASQQVRQELRPYFERVDPWGFFPDMSARNMDEVEFVFQRHLMTEKELRSLVKRPGFNAEAVREILLEKPGCSRNGNGYLQEIRSISGLSNLEEFKRYEIWEYHGPLSSDYLEQEGQGSGLLQMWQGLQTEGLDDTENSVQVNGTVWFCQGRVLKVGINHLDSGELPYAVFCWEQDEACLFGFGIPYLMRGPQRVMNAAYRMILDNAALSTGPQIVMDRGAVEPADGEWRLTPRKIWFKQDRGLSAGDAFQAFHIDSRQPELAAIYNLARQLADEETNQPTVAQGDRLPAGHQTALGLSILHTSANVVQRRTVRNYDDHLTRPLMRRLYQWNMQFNDKPGIKGDFEVDARGSSVLIAREIQAQQLMSLALNFAAHPVFGPLTRAAPLYRKLAQANMLSADEFILSDEEILANQQLQASQQPAAGASPDQPDERDIKQKELALKSDQIAMRREEMQLDAQDRLRQHQLEMARLQGEHDQKIAELQTDINLKDMDVNAREKLQAREIGTKFKFGSGL